MQIPRSVHSQAAQEGDRRELRQYLGEIFHELARQKECEIWQEAVDEGLRMVLHL